MRTTKITAKRPSGEIEVVDVSDKFPAGLTDTMFEKIKAATRQAGRGDLLSYEVISELTEEQKERIAQGKKRSEWFKKNGFESANFN